MNSPDSLLSREEIDALLARDGPSSEGAVSSEAAADSSAQDPFRILLASRRVRERDLLRSRFESRSVAVSCTQDACQTLETLAAESWDAVITDFELWAQRGQALFRSVGTTAKPPLVAFLCDRHMAGKERLVRQNVSALILCPLAARHVELAVSQLIAALNASRASCEAAAEPDGGASEASLEADESRETGASFRDDGETVWLRFFLECQRLRRTTSSQPLFLQRVVDLCCHVLHARGAGVLGVDGSGGSAYVRAMETHLMTRAALALEGRDTSQLRVGDWVSRRGTTRLVLLSLPRHVRSTLADFEADLSDLFS